MAIGRRTFLGGLAATAGLTLFQKQQLARAVTALADPTDFGAVGDGRTDDAKALQAALNSGRKVDIAGRTFAFGSRLVIPGGGGLVGNGHLLMLTEKGKFDSADFQGPFPVGLYMEGVAECVVEARIEMQRADDIRTCSAIWVRNCRDVALKVECWGFREARFGIIEWNSNLRGSVVAYVHDCYVDSLTLPSMQVTGLSIDNNRVDGPVNSAGLEFDVRARNLQFGPRAIARYGYQTDGVNIQGEGHVGHSGRVEAENVHEPLDIFADGNVVEVVARDCLFGVKLIHGASRNVIRATVDRFMKSGLFIGGSNGKQPTAHNRVTLAARGGGEIGTFGDVAAVTIDGSSARLGADNNLVEVSATGNGVDLDYGLQIVRGSGNEVVLQTTGYSKGEVMIAPDSGPANSYRRRNSVSPQVGTS